MSTSNITQGILGKLDSSALGNVAGVLQVEPAQAASAMQHGVGALLGVFARTANAGSADPFVRAVNTSDAAHYEQFGDQLSGDALPQLIRHGNGAAAKLLGKQRGQFLTALGRHLQLQNQQTKALVSLATPLILSAIKVEHDEQDARGLAQLFESQTPHLQALLPPLLQQELSLHSWLNDAHDHAAPEPTAAAAPVAAPTPAPVPAPAPEPVQAQPPTPTPAPTQQAPPSQNPAGAPASPASTAALASATPSSPLTAPPTPAAPVSSAATAAGSTPPTNDPEANLAEAFATARKQQRERQAAADVATPSGTASQQSSSDSGAKSWVSLSTNAANRARQPSEDSATLQASPDLPNKSRGRWYLLAGGLAGLMVAAGATFLSLVNTESGDELASPPTTISFLSEELDKLDDPDASGGNTEDQASENSDATALAAGASDVAATTTAGGDDDADADAAEDEAAADAAQETTNTQNQVAAAGDNNDDAQADPNTSAGATANSPDTNVAANAEQTNEDTQTTGTLPAPPASVASTNDSGSGAEDQQPADDTQEGDANDSPAESVAAQADQDDSNDKGGKVRIGEPAKVKAKSLVKSQPDDAKPSASPKRPQQPHRTVVGHAVTQIPSPAYIPTTHYGIRSVSAHSAQFSHQPAWQRRYPAGLSVPRRVATQW